MSESKIKKILVANRGEIAIRVMRTAREMGIKTVAIYSDADVHSPHVRYADEAVNVGPAPSNQSYLKMDRIIDICLELNVDAIHPGYGFLSENATFAKKVAEKGIIFIGPSTHAIEVMGDKLAAKNAVKAYNVPMIPGVNHAVTDLAEARKIAEDIGYPVLIKASAGGGGKGMRVVERPEDIQEQMQRAMSEAESAFGDKSVFIEKYIGSPRHIEIQVLGDQHGNLVYLFERECSIQRRHQKVIEEAPSSVLTPELRKAMGEAAIGVAKACDYYGAGTVEFIVDENLDFFFLEMNTRLQVEHPVTEEITGIDLVKEQIRIAEGHPLSFSQEDLKIKGHSIEVRVYAENPKENFLPETGRLETYKIPQGPGIRVDDGFEEGMDIPIYYDPMIAKLVATGENREQARMRMLRAINEYEITGISTTLDFCSFALKHDAFISGDFDTKFVQNHFKPEYLDAHNEEEETIAIALAAYALEEKKKATNRADASGQLSKWKLRAKQ
ncbi:acetyl-CoA carboxylase biotin carboxylase subunit [Roseivirga thermotolerans]|jgi:acetyl-CoA carboxylase biotin carboxylase subunit|uniref:Acetyl-CoA carboxylase biotin carboxylase subunit n=1 Tax=Roseivirga thermotolerans TaxID=1758176 RepID=A0ABQ3I6G0_9BACT|nr:acetyl-CoA carboxylase biotin carboxylase subunit [Roseivirga thermotolerans]GHE68294.1 acetyl-CoA carboxylase biotin carboxylase subunit [Roseivirga thermotolerans]